MSRKSHVSVWKARSPNPYQTEFFLGIGPAEMGTDRIWIGLAAAAIVTLDRAGMGTMTLRRWPDKGCSGSASIARWGVEIGGIDASAPA